MHRQNKVEISQAYSCSYLNARFSVYTSWDSLSLNKFEGKKILFFCLKGHERLLYLRD